MTEKVNAAINVIDKVCANSEGTRKEHVVMQEAVGIIVEALRINDGIKAAEDQIKKV